MRLKRFLIPPFVLAPMLALAACDDEPVVEAVVDDGRAASGEVLPGSISDDMIATDRLRSQAPLLVNEPDTGAAGGAGTAEGSAAVAAPEPAPAAEPAPAPEPEAVPETFEEAFEPASQ